MVQRPTNSEKAKKYDEFMVRMGTVHKAGPELISSILRSKGFTHFNEKDIPGYEKALKEHFFDKFLSEMMKYHSKTRSEIIDALKSAGYGAYSPEKVSAFRFALSEKFGFPTIGKKFQMPAVGYTCAFCGSPTQEKQYGDGYKIVCAEDPSHTFAWMGFHMQSRYSFEQWVEIYMRECPHKKHAGFCDECLTAKVEQNKTQNPIYQYGYLE